MRCYFKRRVCLWLLVTALCLLAYHSVSLYFSQCERYGSTYPGCDSLRKIQRHSPTDHRDIWKHLFWTNLPLSNQIMKLKKTPSQPSRLKKLDKPSLLHQLPVSTKPNLHSLAEEVKAMNDNVKERKTVFSANVANKKPKKIAEETAKKRNHLVPQRKVDDSQEDPNHSNGLLPSKERAKVVDGEDWSEDGTVKKKLAKSREHDEAKGAQRDSETEQKQAAPLNNPPAKASVSRKNKEQLKPAVKTIDAPVESPEGVEHLEDPAKKVEPHEDIPNQDGYNSERHSLEKLAKKDSLIEKPKLEEKKQPKQSTNTAQGHDLVNITQDVPSMKKSHPRKNGEHSLDDQEPKQQEKSKISAKKDSVQKSKEKKVAKDLKRIQSKTKPKPDAEPRVPPTKHSAPTKNRERLTQDVPSMNKPHQGKNGEHSKDDQEPKQQEKSKISTKKDSVQKSKEKKVAKDLKRIQSKTRPKQDAEPRIPPTKHSAPTKNRERLTKKIKNENHPKDVESLEETEQLVDPDKKADHEVDIPNGGENSKKTKSHEKLAEKKSLREKSNLKEKSRKTQQSISNDKTKKTGGDKNVKITRSTPQQNKDVHSQKKQSPKQKPNQKPRKDKTSQKSPKVKQPENKKFPVQNPPKSSAQKAVKTHPKQGKNGSNQQAVPRKLIKLVTDPPEPKDLPWWKVRNNACQAVFESDHKKLPNNIGQLISRMDKEAFNEVAGLANSLGINPKREKCSDYLQRQHFVTKSHSEEERNFPVAYSLIVYKDYAQIEHLLRTIYRPEHTICIHLDASVKGRLREQLQHLANCFPKDNVFMSNVSIDVVWGKYSSLEAELVCMRQLLALWKTRKWRYFINLTGQEYPLRTNLELVRILKLLKGANAMEALVKHVERDRIPKSKLSFGVRWTKGALHIVATARYVNFTINDPKAIAIREVLRKEGKFPDEFYFSTLNHSPQLGTPGAYTGIPATDKVTYPYINRIKQWIKRRNYPKAKCRSNRVSRQICIWGVLDVPRLRESKALFINKFHWDFNHLALQCMQEWYWQRVHDELNSTTHSVQVDLNWYTKLPQIKKHI